ncbi:MAG: DMT family transporter, partial [Alphaproteobacteria bacterium]
PFTLIAWGQTGIESGLSGILVGTMPLMTLALAAAFVPGEAVTGRKLAGFLAGFAGLAVLLGPAALGLVAEESLVHQVAVLGGAFCYAANTILTKRMPATPVLGAATAICLCAALVSVPVALALDRPWTVDPSARSLGGITFLALFPTALAAWVYISLIRSAGPSFTAQVNYLTPVCAVILGALVLGERPGPNALAGLALILAGIAVSQGRRRRSEENPPTEIKDARSR